MEMSKDGVLENVNAGGVQLEQIQKSTTTTEESQSEKTIKLEDHKRALDDMIRFKNASREKDQIISELQRKFSESKQAEKSADLHGKQDFKGLWELERQGKLDAQKETEDARNEANKLKELVGYNEKLKAVQKGLLESGFRKEALNMLSNENLESLELEITSKGNFNVHGIPTFVESFKKQYGFLFATQQNVLVNAGGGATVAEEKPLTDAYMVELSRSNKPGERDKFKELWPKYMLQRKTNGLKK
jgi:hypothetical protein